MAAPASALAQHLVQFEDEDILQALTLLISQRPGLIGPIVDSMQVGPPKRYSGVISAFYPEKHFGFIKSDEITAEYGTDTFLSDKELGSFSVGSAVTFSVAINKNNKPQARLLEDGSFQEPAWKRHRPNPTGGLSGDAFMSDGPAFGKGAAFGKGRKGEAFMDAGAAFDKGAKGQMGGKGDAFKDAGAPSGKGQKGAKGRAPAFEDPSEQRYVGVISAFYPEKKFGFIKSDEVFSLYGVDTFLSQMEIGNFGVESVVSYKVAINAKGQPQARELQDAFEGFEGAGGQAWEQAGAGQQDPLSVRYVGQIHHFVPERKFGFIGCEDVKVLFGVETFLSSKEIGNFSNDDTVYFNITLNAKGQPQAHGLHGTA